MSESFLKRNENFSLMLAVESSCDPVVEIERDGTILYANNIFWELVGESSFKKKCGADDISEKIFKFIKQKYQQLFQSKIIEGLNESEFCDGLEVCLTHSRGKVLIYPSILTQAKASTVLLTFKRINTSEDYCYDKVSTLEGMIDKSPCILFSLKKKDSDWIVSYLSSSFFKVFSQDPKLFYGLNIKKLSKLIIKEDKQDFEEAFYRKKDLKNGEFNFDFKVKKSDGDVRLISAFAELVDSEERIIGYFFDKTKEAKLGHEFSQLHQALNKSSIVGVTDVKGRIIYANNNFCQVSGYTLWVLKRILIF